jgi:RNA polymerase sigma factor (TIGR02999 family)
MVHLELSLFVREPFMTSVKLTEAVYTDLRLTARRLFARERPGHLLQPEALIHEAWLRLAAENSWRDHMHLRAAALLHMRRILIDHGRRRRAVKHGANRFVGIEAAFNASVPPSSDPALCDLLDRLRRVEPVSARVVELKFFSGMTDLEIAAVLGVSPRSARRHWNFARHWLRLRLRGAA